MVKHIVIGRTEKNAPPVCVYAGDLASEAEAAKLNFPQCSTFETFSQLQGVVKRNPNHDPSAPGFIVAYVSETDLEGGQFALQLAELEKTLQSKEEEFVAYQAEIQEMKERISRIPELEEALKGSISQIEAHAKTIQLQLDEINALKLAAQPIVEDQSEDEEPATDLEGKLDEALPPATKPAKAKK